MRIALFSIFNPYDDLILSFSEKADGSCRLRPTGRPKLDAIIKKNRERYLSKLGLDATRLVSASLVHENVAYLAEEKDAGNIITGVDALTTRTKNLFLSITVADCLPIFLYDRVGHCIGLVHAGWRGLTTNVIGNTMQKMKYELKSTPENIIAGIGPGIGSCHFEAKADVLEKFKKIPHEVLRKTGGKTFLDLKAIARMQLESSGIKAENIEMSRDCTYDMADRYFSYRRDKPEFLETMLAIIGLK